MNNIIVRKAKKNDYEAIKGLTKELYDTLEDTTGMVENLDQEKFEDIITDPKISILVADSDQGVIGYITLNFHKALIDSGITALIDELIITKSARGKGAGKLLINTAIKKSRYIGCSEIGVGTEYSNIKAREFYKKAGFKEVGVIFEKILE